MATGLLAAAAGFVVAASNTGPVLNIKATPLPGAHGTVQGAQREPMLGFTLEAKNKAILIESLTFNVLADSDGNFKEIQNDLSASDLLLSCMLINKRTGAAVASPVSVTNGNMITFEDKFTLTANSITPFTILCDHANTLITNPYIMGVELTGYPGYVVATVAATGNNLPDNRINVGTITDAGVNVALTTSVTIRSRGMLQVSLSPIAPSSDLTIKNSSVKAAAFKFTAAGEAYTIQKLTIQNIGDDAAVKTIKITYKNASGATITNTSTLSNHFAQFSGIDIAVPTGAANAATVEVTVDTADISATGSGSSGQTFSEAIAFLPGGLFKAVGNTSGSVITESEMGYGYQGGTFTLRETRPTITLHSASPTGPAVPGRNEVLRFNVAADPAEDLSMSQITFKVNATSVDSPWASCGSSTVSGLGDVTKWELKDLTTGEVLTNNNSWIIMNADGGQCGPTDRVQSVIAYALANLVHGTIFAGTTHTLSLIVDSTGASQSQDDQIQVEITSEPTHEFPLLHSIQWREGVNGPDLINGSFIKNLPIRGFTLQF